jgi:hypothetical protein
MRAWDGNSGAVAVWKGGQLVGKLLKEREALFWERCGAEVDEVAEGDFDAAVERAEGATLRSAPPVI